MNNAFTYTRLSRDDAVLLLVDHQAGLISLVQDFSPNEFKNNVLALSACGKYFGLPTILTTSFEEGPNGPLVPEIKEMHPAAPYIARPGNINAWDIAAGMLLVREAGGFVSDCDSERNPMETGNILAANADLLPQFRDALKDARKEF